MPSLNDRLQIVANELKNSGFGVKVSSLGFITVYLNRSLNKSEVMALDLPVFSILQSGDEVIIEV